MKIKRHFFNMRQYVYLTAILPFLMIQSVVGQNKVSNGQFFGSTSTEYETGAINIKLMDGIRPYTDQMENISFGHPSLDRIAEEYKVHILAKRFNHKPIPRNSKLPDISRIYHVKFPEHYNVWDVAAAFASDPNVDYAEPIPSSSVADVPDDPMYSSLQHLPQIMAEEAWAIHKGEDGTEEVIVAIVDTGVDWDHEDLQSNVWENMAEDADGDGQTMEFISGEWVLDPGDLNGIDDDNNGFVDDLIGWNFINNNSDVRPILTNPVADHGTHCAGISAASTNNGTGIASISWNISLMGVCTDENNSLPYGYDGIIYAAENGADIISNSWSGSNPSQVNQEVIDYATGLGSIVLAAAGNHNSLVMHYPASYLGAVSVASVSENDSKASYSAYGFAIDISAPGGGSEGGILSTLLNNGYGNKSGTSMATPLVAGLLGLVKSYYPDWTNEELLVQILGTADDISAQNPNYPNVLGSGRINAYYALVAENVLPPQELKLDIASYSLEDGNGNGMLEPGDEVVVSASFRNFSQLTGSDEVTFTLTTFDPDVTITTASFTTDVPADSEFEIEDAFVFEVNEEAEMHVATFFIEVSADIPVIVGQDFRLEFILAPSGFYVWDGEMNETGYSGEFITQYLEEQGFGVFHSNLYPHSFNGFDGVFLSFSNGGEQASEAILFDYRHTLSIQEYLVDGGNLYIEGMAVMSIPEYFGFPNAAVLKNLFGVANSTFGFVSNPISSLEGQDETLGEGMTFTASNQTNNWYIDQVNPASSANTPFVEVGYGNVSLANDGTLGQKTFFLGYAMAELVDVDPVSSRYNMLIRIMDFFGYPQSTDFVVANFDLNETDVLPDDEVQFTDWSISDEGNSINSWAWDFNEDGEIDASIQDPTWTFSSGGNYDIMLVVSNGLSTDTLIRKDAVMVREGILVYEGEMNGVDQSGTFINNFMEENGYSVTYTNQLPGTLIGFDAVFISLGSAYFTSPFLDDIMTNTIKNYILQGGRIYLEGANALGDDQAGNNLLWFGFGIEDVDNGTSNTLDLLSGKDGSIMEGIEFTSSNQIDVSSIDVFQPYATETAIPAFEESDYGTVAVQFDGTEFYGQKTFCMSYTLANLDDGNNPNTREEVLQRIIDFFLLTTDISSSHSTSGIDISLYPNPANDRITVSWMGEIKSDLVFEMVNIWGQKIMRRTEKGNLPQGKINIEVDVKHLDPGTYFYKISGDQNQQSGKIIIAR